MTSVSELTGNNYAKGFMEGFEAQNAGLVDRFLAPNFILRRNALTGGQIGNDIGDIDLAYTLLSDCNFRSLLAVDSSVKVDNAVPQTLLAGTKIFFELTAYRGEDLIQINTRGGVGSSKLTKKVDFYNTVASCFPGIMAQNDIVLIVYNGVDPVAVKQTYDSLQRNFLGGVVHFPRDKVSQWAETVRADKATQLAEANRLLAETERVRAETERVRAEAAEAEIARLRSLLGL